MDRTPTGLPVRSNEYQTLGAQIKYMRAQMRPFMTQQQLADRSGVSLCTIQAIEVDRTTACNPQIMTLKKLAHAMDCRVFVTMRPRKEKKPSRASGGFPLEYPEAPDLPKRTHKATGQARKRALSSVRSYLKNYRRRAYHEQHKATSENRDLGLSEFETDE